MTSADPGSVLYVTYDGLLEPLGASQVLPYVVGLARRGFGLEVLSFEKREDLHRAGAVQELAASLASEGVGWTCRRYHGRPTLPATLFDVAVGRRAVTRWARRARTGGAGLLVHARGYLPGLMGLAARRLGARLLFDMRGFWVDERIEGGFWRPGSPHVRISRWIERELLRSADHVVVLTRSAAARLGGLSPGVAPPASTVLPTCVDLDRFCVPERPAEAKAALGLPDRPTLIHTGNLIGWYDGPATVRVGKTFVERTGGTFVILTRQTEVARDLVRAEGVDARIHAVDPRDVPRWLQASDAGLALVRSTPAKDASFPTKLGEYLAVGLAALTTDFGNLRDLEDGVVLRVLGSDEAASEAGAWLAEAVGRPDRSERARAIAAAHLSLTAGVEALAGIYRRLGVSPS